MSTTEADRDAYREVVRELLGVGDPVPPPAGRGGTEPRTMFELLTANGAAEEEARRLVPLALEGFRRRLTPRELAARGRVLPGAAAALAACVGTGALLGVATGNTRPVARAKLAAFRLAGPIDWRISGCSDDADDKARIVERARLRAGPRPGVPHPAHRTVLVGDSLADARACSAAAVVGVATGRTPAPDLSTAGAARVLPDLRDTEAVVEAIRAALDSARARAHPNEEGP